MRLILNLLQFPRVRNRHDPDGSGVGAERGDRARERSGRTRVIIVGEPVREAPWARERRHQMVRPNFPRIGTATT